MFQDLDEEYQERFRLLTNRLVSCSRELRKKQLALKDKLKLLDEDEAIRSLLNDLPPEIFVRFKRRIIEVQYSFVQVEPSVELLRFVQLQYERFGYDYPTLWGTIRLELARALRDAGEFDEARILLEEAVRFGERQSRDFEVLILKPARRLTES